MLSARAGADATAEGLAEGADDYLIKPFAARELLSRVSSHLERVRMRTRATREEHMLRMKVPHLVRHTGERERERERRRRRMVIT
jgi:DNA-binding response OmpR family regulator